MRLLILNENSKVREDSSGNLYTIDFSDEVWNRYFSIADEIVYVARKEMTILSESDALKQYRKIKYDKVIVKFVYDLKKDIKCFSSVKKRVYNRKLIENEIINADAVIVRSSPISLRSLKKILIKYKKPYLVECVGCIWDAFWNHGFKGKILAPYLFLSQRNFIKKSNYVVYVTEEFLQSRYPTLGKQIGISDVDIPIRKKEILDKRIEHIRKNNGKIILGTAAAIDVKYKGQKYVIDALAQLKRHGITKYEYQLAGAGSSRYLLEYAKKRGVEENIVFCGSLSKEGIFDWLDNIDVYIQPSLLEGLPRAVIEAMSRALPCVLSDVGEMPKLVSPDFIFHKKNVRKIIEILQNLNNEVLQQQAIRNFQRTKKYEKSIRDIEWIKFYTDMLSYN